VLRRSFPAYLICVQYVLCCAPLLSGSLLRPFSSPTPTSEDRHRHASRTNRQRDNVNSYEAGGVPIVAVGRQCQGEERIVAVVCVCGR
jgi:hypothetical protein